MAVAQQCAASLLDHIEQPVATPIERLVPTAPPEVPIFALPPAVHPPRPFLEPHVLESLEGRLSRLEESVCDLHSMMSETIETVRALKRRFEIDIGLRAREPAAKPAGKATTKRRAMKRRRPKTVAISTRPDGSLSRRDRKIVLPQRYRD